MNTIAGTTGTIKKDTGLLALLQQLQHSPDWAIFSVGDYIWSARVPIGLIDASLGGTTVEAWLSPTTLNKMPENKALVKQWNDKEAAYDPVEDLKTKITNWEKRSLVLKSQGLEPAPKPVEPSVRPSLDRNFPGSSYTGMVAIIGGLTVKGVVFHQGYNNALGDSRPSIVCIKLQGIDQ